MMPSYLILRETDRAKLDVRPSNEAGETGKSSSHCVAQGPQLIARQASIATPVTPAGPSHFASS